MTDLFTFADAKQRRDTGMARAAVAQEQKSPRWSEIAYAAIEAIARRQLTVHVDDVLRAGIPKPQHPNAYGAVWLRAVRNGIIQRSAETRPCTVDPAKHAHRYSVYFSRIHDPRCAP